MVVLVSQFACQRTLSEEVHKGESSGVVDVMMSWRVLVQAMQSDQQALEGLVRPSLHGYPLLVQMIWSMMMSRRIRLRRR